MEQADRDLVERILKRDAFAFRELYNRYSEAIFSHLSRLVRDKAAAEDLVQEVFLRVWNRAEQWNDQGPFRAWLFRIASNLAFNHLRSVQRRREQPLEILPNSSDDEESSAPGWMIDAATLGPDALLELTEQGKLLRQFIDELPEDKRDIFRMIYDAEMDVREVAERLGIPEGTVKSRLYHGRRRIAQEWQDLETGSEEME